MLAGLRAGVVAASSSKLPQAGDGVVLRNEDGFPIIPPPPPSSGTLRGAVIVARHGDRTPISPTLGTTHKFSASLWTALLPSAETATTFWSRLHPRVGWQDPGDVKGNLESRGALTERGGEQLRALGASLRQRWIRDLGFLPRALDQQSISVRSTPIIRCQQSAANLLLGLYPVSARRPGAMAVPIETRDAARETMWGGWWCPRIKSSYDRVDAEFAKLAEADQELAALDAAVRPALGIEGRLNWLAVGGTLSCWGAHPELWRTGLPNWIATAAANLGVTVEEFIARFGRCRDRAYIAKFGLTEDGSGGLADPQIPQLKASGLMTDITEALQFVVRSRVAATAGARSNEHQPSAGTDTARRLQIYAAHDTTLVPLLVALKLTDYERFSWPEYASYVLFELYEDNTPPPSTPAAFAVRVIYNGREVQLPGQQGPLIPWDDFVKVLAAHGMSSRTFVRECYSPSRNE